MNTTPKPITLATLPNATAQEVFDWVAFNLLKQGEKSIGPSGCQYRNPKGLKCAAGWCIGDSEYNPKWEGTTWDSLYFQGKVPSSHHYLIDRLQLSVHDFAIPAEWKTRLFTVAKQFNLSPAILDNFA